MDLAKRSDLDARSPDVSPDAPVERAQVEGELFVKSEPLLAITEATALFLQDGDWKPASIRLLRAALGQTRSEYGFVGVLVEGPVLRILAHEGIVWDQAVNREFYEGAVRRYREVGYLEFTNFSNLFGEVVKTGEAVRSNDPARDPRAGGLPPGHPPLRSFLGVPIRSKGEAVGMIAVANRDGGYGPREQARIEVLTGAAGLLYDSYRRRERERAAVLALEENRRRLGRLVDSLPGVAYRSLLDHDGTMEYLSEGCERLVGYKADELIRNRVRSFRSLIAPDDRRRVTEALRAAAVEERPYVVEYKVRTKAGQERWLWEKGKGVYAEGGEPVALEGFITDITDRKQAEMIRLRLLDRVMVVQEEERGRIARELHDEAGQALTSLLVRLAAVEDMLEDEAARGQLADLRRLTSAVVAELQRLAKGLRPTMLDDLGIEAALHRYAADCAKTHGIAVKLHSSGLAARRLPAPVETALFRIAQEALTNAVKHAGAGTVNLLVQADADSVRLIVEDDGCGLPEGELARILDGWSHLGLYGIKERAMLLGGTFSIESAPGRGFTIYVTIPTTETAR